jgi:MFS family permease
MATATAPAPAELQFVTRGINPWVIALTVTIATFMELLDTSIANVSLPYIAGGLGRSYDEVTWILTTYLVANAVVLPMSAWLSRVFGRKNYYMACVGLFTVTSFLCGVAPTLGIMLIARVMQGIGGAGDPGGHVLTGKASVGVRGLHGRDRDGAGDRAGAGGLDHGQLQLAVGLPDQYSDWVAVVVSDQSICA